MKRSLVRIPTWVFSALTLYVLGLAPLCASGAQETGGVTRQDSAAHTEPSNDRTNLQSLVEELVARSPEIKAARERWEAPRLSCLKSKRSLIRDFNWGISACR